MNAYAAVHRTYTAAEVAALHEDPLWRGRTRFAVFAPGSRWHAADLSYRPDLGETWQDAFRRHLDAWRDWAVMEERQGAAA